MTIDEVRAVASMLPRSTEGHVRGRVKFRIGRIVYLSLSRDGSTMGFAFPKELREALVESEPEKFSLPSESDMRYHWAHVRLDAIDADEMRELVEDAWAFCVPKRVAESTPRRGATASERRKSYPRDAVRRALPDPARQLARAHRVCQHALALRFALFTFSLSQLLLRHRPPPRVVRFYGVRRRHSWGAARYLTSVSILNIGRYIEMMITPTIRPTPIIMIGSMIEVSVWIDASTSSS